ncbi:hypothetical protein GYB22_13750 [bacterium]|nr:hypothetical protein [bacterium]
MKKLAPYLRKLLYVLGLILLIVFLIVLNGKHAGEPVQEVNIEIDVPAELQLITQERIQELISIWYPGGLVGMTISDLDLNEIEKKLELEAAVKQADVSVQLNGRVDIEIDQRLPLVRMFKSGGYSFYMDDEGEKIPANGLNPARVPVATEMDHDTLIKKVYTLSTYVHENEFMEALTEQIFVSKQGDLTIIPKIHHHQIIVGDTLDLEDKFNRLQMFYKDGLKNLGWDKYKSINLKFKDQVVCN